MINPNVDLDDLIHEPREALDIQVKEWLDLADNDHRSMIAKEIIALANHGGGFLVIGFEERADGQGAGARSAADGPRCSNFAEFKP